MSRVKVVVLGAAGGIGQPLSLLLKCESLADEIALYDIAESRCPPEGVACDLSHIDTPCDVTAFAGKDQLPEALKGATVVLMTAGLPRMPGMSRDDLFTKNAEIVKGLAEECVKHCPDAFLGIITNPVNSMVPLAATVYEEAGKFDHRRLVGITTLDCCRADKFVSEVLKCDPKNVHVPVIGGHAGESIMPILSGVNWNGQHLTEKQIMELDAKIQNAGTEVVEKKKTAGSATLSMAYAAAKFCRNVLKGRRGENASEYCYLKSDFRGCAFFTKKCDFGELGVSKVHEPVLSTDYEKKRVEEVITKLCVDIEMGLRFVKH